LFSDSGTGEGAVIATRETLNAALSVPPYHRRLANAHPRCAEGRERHYGFGRLRKLCDCACSGAIHWDDDARWVRGLGLCGLSEEPQIVSTAV
jgi:hypothetical protein